MAAVTMAAASIASPLAVSRDVSSRASFATASPSLMVKSVSSRTVCSMGNKAGQTAAALALAAVLTTGAFAMPQEASADVAGLTPCKDSKAFAKREKQEVKGLERRLKLYEADSAPALAIQATIEKTHKRFDFYGKQGLLCGTDGLPHLIVDGDLNHAGEFVSPGIVFLYIAGWIGWVGRQYLIKIRSEKKPTEKEIIIDVPLALSLMGRGFTWPLAAIRDLKSGDLIADKSTVTVSPR